MSISSTPEQLINQEFQFHLQSGDTHALHSFLDEQNISDVANLIYDNEENENLIIRSLSINRAASVFKILEIPTQKRIIKNLPPNITTELLNELPIDDRVSFLEELPAATVRDLIKNLSPAEIKETLSALGYPEDSVGRLMNTDYVYVYEHNTVAEALDTIRRFGKDSETIDVIYVINDKGELLDDLRIKEFILAKPESKVSDLMDGRFISLNVNENQENANEAFKMNNRVALPVTDNKNVLLGIVTIDDVLWVANEEFSEDIQKIGGTEALNEPYLEINLLQLYKKRVIWLIVLFFGELITIFAMSKYEDSIAKVVLLATFIPLIISSGGNSGSQASTLIIQAMALGEVTIKDWWTVIRREIISGLLLGFTLSLFGFAVITIWSFFEPETFKGEYIRIALAISCSLIGTVLWGTLMGSMLPLFLKRVGADPAASSTPFVATLVDVTGLIIYFTITNLFLRGVLL